METSGDRGSVTQLLHQWSNGDRSALDELMPVVYDQLHRLASRSLRSEKPNHTLAATALVNEAYLRLVQADVDWQDRAHFFAVSA
ncbi:MAG TPA: ECF-type sigma factor, partial [Acidobacteriaceae bacterium]|nr:ECF-type sigma factor [Acidobacteriaceae bacterium]